VNYPFTELNLPTIRVYIVRQGAVHQDSLFHLVYCNLFSVLPPGPSTMGLPPLPRRATRLEGKGSVHGPRVGLKLVFICAHVLGMGEGWGGYIL
jgi:hypothetical protein